MKRRFSFMLALLMALSCATVQAEGSAAAQPPENPGAMPPQGAPVDGPAGAGPGGTPPEGEPGARPEGTPPAEAPGGAAAPEQYDAVYALSEDAELTGAIESTGTDENAVHLASGTLKMRDAAVVRSSQDSAGGDAASFYGVGAAVLVTGGTAEISASLIDTDANGGAGVFAYGDGVVSISDSSIETRQDTSGGIHVAGGGTLRAENVQVVTQGESSAAIRSDRGGGKMEVHGGSYSTSGAGSPAVYVTADVSISDATLTATGSEALCLEGKNAVRLQNCALSGNLPDLEQNDNSWTVILYQSMSGDAEVGEGRFEMSGGTLSSGNGGLFYTTNTDSEFVLSGVEIQAAPDCEYFLRCTGNANRRGWGETGGNGANCRFTAIGQQMRGDIVWDSISNLSLYVTAGSALTGAGVDDESCAGGGGAGSCALYIDSGSSWTVTGDSVLTNLYCAGTIADAAGRTVTIAGADGTVYVQGDSPYRITVSAYAAECDLSGAGALSDAGADA